jgi:hypothetical protein
MIHSVAGYTIIIQWFLVLAKDLFRWYRFDDIRLDSKQYIANTARKLSVQPTLNTEKNNILE